MTEIAATDFSATTLKVNGVEHTIAAHPDTLLLYVLRNDVGLKGTLFGCGSGLCGACFVLIDDHATASCDTPLWAVSEKAVTTIEGLANDGLSNLQQSFIDRQAGQCGYCLSGILVTATALIRQHPQPSRDQVVEALDRNLCRCGSHSRIIEAVMNAASP